MLRTRLVFFSLLSAFAFSSPCLAQDGFFLEARGGNASIDEDEFDDTTTAFEIGGGYRWGGLGLEGGYVTFNDFESDVLDLRINAELDGWYFGGTGRFNFAEQWYVSGRLGAFLWSADADTPLCITTGTSTTCATTRVDDDGVNFYAGAGIGYDFNENLSLGVAYDYFDASLEQDDDNGDEEVSLNTNVFWLTGEIRF